MGDRIRRNFATIILLALLTTIFFLAAIYIPFAGIFINIFAPAPLIIAYLKYSNKVSLGMVAAIALALYLALGAKTSLMFTAEHGAMALVMGEALRRRLTAERCVLFGAVVAALSMVLFTGAYHLVSGMRFLDYADSEIVAELDKMIRHYQGLNVANEQGRLVGAVADKFWKIAAMSFPSLIVIGSILAALLNYLTVRWLAKGLGVSSFDGEKALAHWSVPDYFIWFLLAAGAAVLAPAWVLNRVGLNVLIIALFAYFLQGLAITSFYLKKIPAMLRYFGYALIALQPLVALIVTGLGVFDLWLDFRKISPGRR